MNFKRKIALILTSLMLVSSMPIQMNAAENAGITITLDPGHGYNYEENTYTGATGATKWGGKVEDLYNWDIAQHCKKRLEEYGVRVVLTKNSAEQNPSFDSRVKGAARNGSVAFISIHNNSNSKTSAKGTQIYTVNPNYNAEMYTNTCKLADSIMSRLNNDAGTHKNCDPYYYNSQSGSKHPDGSIQEYYGVLWRAKRYSEGTTEGKRLRSKLMAGMIVECVFQSNESDVKNFLLKPEKVEALGVAIADGIADHYGLKLLSEQETEPVTTVPVTAAPEPETTVLETETPQTTVPVTEPVTAEPETSEPDTDAVTVSTEETDPETEEIIVFETDGETTQPPEKTGLSTAGVVGLSVGAGVIIVVAVAVIVSVLLKKKSMSADKEEK